MKPLDAHSWSQLKINKDKFPNGTVISEIMEAYAEYVLEYYYEKEFNGHDKHLRDKKNFGTL